MTSDGLILELSGSITVRHAQGLSNAVTTALGSSAAVLVDAGGVEDMDASILQLLCSLRKSVPAFEFTSQSKELVNAADRSALRRELFATAKE